jgi:hypothetical protein
MKKFIYILMLPVLFSANKMSAQSFSVPKDTVSTALYGYADVFDNITNLTTDTIRVTWRIINHTMPQSWVDYASFGLCDNTNCYDRTILSTGTQLTDTISANKQCLFKVQINSSSAMVTPGGPYYVAAELTHQSTVDTVVFAFYKWPSSVSKTAANKDEVTLYPNPAINDLNITFSKDLNVKNITVYNLVGKQVSNYRVSSDNAKLDLDKIPSGIYFVRLMDNNGHVVATRRFTHQ